MDILNIQEIAFNVIIIVVQQKVIIANVQVVMMNIIYMDINVLNVIQPAKHVLIQLINALVVKMDII